MQMYIVNWLRQQKKICVKRFAKLEMIGKRRLASSKIAITHSTDFKTKAIAQALTIYDLEFAHLFL